MSEVIDEDLKPTVEATKDLIKYTIYKYATAKDGKKVIVIDKVENFQQKKLLSEKTEKTNQLARLQKEINDINSKLALFAKEEKWH